LAKGKAVADIRVANAPCSWGTLEFAEYSEGRIGYQQMLDELVETGYTGTELGDWGFMPTTPDALQPELDDRGLTMLAGFVQCAFTDPDAHADGAAQACRVAELLAAVARPGQQGPYIVLADANGTDPVRTRNAGRVEPGMGLSAEGWSTFASGVERVARAVADATGLRSVFHPHCAGFVETPDEIEQILDLVDGDVLGLCFDTGHYTFAGGDALEGLHRFEGRIDYVHFKDCESSIAGRARAEEWDYFKAVGQGVFCELGEGEVDFPAVVQSLRDRGYDGWCVVEQDVLPQLGTPIESARRNRAYLERLGL
jgi:inosose dehydratase